MRKSAVYFFCLITVFLSSCSLYQQGSNQQNPAGDNSDAENSPVSNNASTKTKVAELNRDEYQLVWSDEFYGSKINTANWGFEIGPTWYNSERQAYTDKNARVENGMLIIEARNEPYPDSNGAKRYTSSRLLTQGKQSWKYGIFEARFKRPKGEGSFPAFWMMGNSYSKAQGNWPACGEIGIAEFLHTEDVSSWSKAITNLHYGDTFEQHKALDSVGVAPSMQGITDGFHTYTFEWTPTTMTWYLDGQVVEGGVVEYTKLPDYNNEFNAQAFFFLFSFGVGFDMYGGSVAGNPDRSSWPKQLSIDWVRVYQLKQ